MEGVYLLPINGVIGEDFKYSDFLLHLHNSKDYPTIKLLVGSVGGFVDDGFKIREALINSGKTIIATNTGDVASIAVGIFLTANKGNRTFDPSKGVFLIHNPWTEVEGDANYLSEVSKMLKKDESQILSQYENATGASPEILAQFMAEDTPLTPEQIEQLGFATIIKPEFKAVAKLSINSNNLKMTEKEVTEKLSNIEKILLGFKNLFPKAKCLLVQDVNGTELDFGAEITEPSQIVVGVKATIKGAPATGEYTMPDGSTIVFDETGTVTEIKTGDNELEALKAENDALKLELEGLKTQNLEVSNQLKTISDESQKQLLMLNEEFKNFKAQYSKGGEHKVNVPTPAPKGDEKQKFSFKIKK